MFSRKLQLFYFVGALQHHYRARLDYMLFPIITHQIFDLLVCLRKDKLIAGFTVYYNPSKTAFRSVKVFFYYINNNGLLFQHIRGIRPKLYLSVSQIRLILQQKASLAFPILIIETPTHGIVTDRQLVYLQINGIISDHLGGRLIARIDNY